LATLLRANVLAADRSHGNETTLPVVATGGVDRQQIWRGL
jgi:hypothetical protein